MRVPRESVSVALYNLFYQNQTLTRLCNTITRKPALISDVNPPQKPWLCCFKGGPGTEQYIQPQQVQIGLTKYGIYYNLWLYIISDPANKILAETTANEIADAVDVAFQTNPTSGVSAFGERQTLGGLVNNAWIEGGLEWDAPIVDNNMMLAWRIAIETGI